MTVEEIEIYVAPYPANIAAQVATKTCYKCPNPAVTIGVNQQEYVCAACCSADDDIPMIMPYLKPAMDSKP